MKKRYFNLNSRKEWLESCCWNHIRIEKQKDGGFIDGKLYICRECGNKIIAERDDVWDKHGIGGNK